MGKKSLKVVYEWVIWKDSSALIRCCTIAVSRVVGSVDDNIVSFVFKSVDCSVVLYAVRTVVGFGVLWFVLDIVCACIK